MGGGNLIRQVVDINIGQNWFPDFQKLHLGVSKTHED